MSVRKIESNIMKMLFEDTIRARIVQGAFELLQSGSIEKYTQTLNRMIRKVRNQRDTEVRFTSRSLNAAMCMFNVAYQQLQRSGRLDIDKSTFPNLELTNNSAIVFLHDG
jgi:hypothetical protein